MIQRNEDQVHNQGRITIPIHAISLGVATRGVQAAVIGISPIREMKQMDLNRVFKALQPVAERHVDSRNAKVREYYVRASPG